MGEMKLEDYGRSGIVISILLVGTAFETCSDSRVVAMGGDEEEDR